MTNYTIQKKKIKVAPSVKYLVYIDDHLTWKDHINHVVNKANSARAFLQRNINSCPTSVKDACYKSMIRPIAENAATTDLVPTYSIQYL